MIVLTDRGLAERLRPYGIKSKDVWISGTTRKGYDRSDSADVWSRYLASWDQGDEGEEIDIKEQKPSGPSGNPVKMPALVVDNPDPFSSLKDKNRTPDLAPASDDLEVREFLDRRKQS